MEGIDIPLLHIAEPMAQAVEAHGLHTVALLGTKATMSSTYLPDIFTKQHGIDVVLPNVEEQDFIDKVMF